MDHINQGDVDNLFLRLRILMFEHPVGHDEENDINRDDFPGIVFTVEYEDQHGQLKHLEVRLPRYLTAFNQNRVLLRTHRALRELFLYLWRPDTSYSPLASMLAWHTDVWGVTVHAAGESLTLGFYPLHANNPPAAHDEIPAGDEHPRPSHQDSREARARASSAPAGQCTQAVPRHRGKSKRKSKTSQRPNTQRRRSRSDPLSDSSHDSSGFYGPNITVTGNHFW